MKARPRGRFQLLSGIGYPGSPLGRKDNGLPENYLIEISRLNVRLNDEPEQLLANLVLIGWCSARGCPSTTPTRPWPRSTFWRPVPR